MRVALLVTAALSAMLPATSMAGESGIPAAPVRFLLTFDDGPSPRATDNPTAHILDLLTQNPIQPGIKAVFFVQTRSPKSGGSPEGQALLRRIRDEGHVLALHSGTARGHINHTQMPPEELEQSLRDGADDIRALMGAAPRLVRPPYWSFTHETLTAYERQGLHMLMYDVRVGDGVSFGNYTTWWLRLRVDYELRRIRNRIRAGVVPPVGDVIPLIVVFHDPNPHTAEKLPVFLRLLVEEARKLDLPVATTPFFTDVAEVNAMALARAPGFLKWANATGLGRTYP
jgi:peptidoglycan/xylan/chitin deacetylase (PgdA/CDA1 family)